MNKQLMKKHYEVTPKETLIDILINSRDEIEKEKEHRRKEVDYWRIKYSDLLERIDKAIEIINIYGTSNYETADLLYSALRGSDKE